MKYKKGGDNGGADEGAEVVTHCVGDAELWGVGCVDGVTVDVTKPFKKFPKSGSARYKSEDNEEKNEGRGFEMVVF